MQSGEIGSPKSGNKWRQGVDENIKVSGDSLRLAPYL